MEYRRKKATTREAMDRVLEAQARMGYRAYDVVFDAHYSRWYAYMVKIDVDGDGSWVQHER